MREKEAEAEGEWRRRKRRDEGRRSRKVLVGFMVVGGRERELERGRAGGLDWVSLL